MSHSVMCYKRVSFAMGRRAATQALGLRGPIAILFMSRNTCSGSVAKLVCACFYGYRANIARYVAKRDVAHMCLYETKYLGGGGIAPFWGSAILPEKVSRDMGYRSDSIATSRDTGPISLEAMNTNVSKVTLKPASSCPSSAEAGITTWKRLFEGEACFRSQILCSELDPFAIKTHLCRVSTLPSFLTDPYTSQLSQGLFSDPNTAISSWTHTHTHAQLSFRTWAKGDEPRKVPFSTF